MAAVLLQAIDISTALDGLPVAAAVAIAVLWNKVRNLEGNVKDQAKRLDDNAALVSDLKAATAELRAVVEGLRELVSGFARIQYPKEVRP